MPAGRTCRPPTNTETSCSSEIAATRPVRCFAHRYSLFDISVYSTNSIYRGILTGYNKAFLVDDSQRRRLIAEDPKSAEILKPILKGRDIQRYRASWAGLWLIATHNGYDDVPAVRIDEYPAVRRHLDQFYDRLEKRYDKGSTPYNLRNCAYHADFAAPKLLWIELTEQGRFAYDDTGALAEATAFILTGAPTKYLCGILNSPLVHWFLQHTAPTSGMGTLRWKKAYLRNLPIPYANPDGRHRLIRLVDRVLRAKDADPLVDTSGIEAEIEQQVFKLYGLEAMDIGAITA